MLLKFWQCILHEVGNLITEKNQILNCLINILRLWHLPSWKLIREILTPRVDNHTPNDTYMHYYNVCYYCMYLYNVCCFNAYMYAYIMYVHNIYTRMHTRLLWMGTMLKMASHVWEQTPTFIQVITFIMNNATHSINAGLHVSVVWNLRLHLILM